MEGKQCHNSVVQNRNLILYSHTFQPTILHSKNLTHPSIQRTPQEQDLGETEDLRNNIGSMLCRNCATQTLSVR
eukprot:m.171895 g.171895  ORF g.171895 m.171895 type:complete len:74 (+) comp15359_c0_seq3:1921-2142(+)